VWFRALGKIVNGPFERPHASAEEEVEPPDLRGYHSQLDKFARPAGPTTRRRPERAARSDEAVEGGNQGVAEGCRPEHRVDVRQVVIHPCSVDADDVTERVVHRSDSLF
jgi:hypothetical protein